MGQNKLTDAKHPIWAIARLAVIMTGATFFCWVNATNFDETEIKALFGLGATAGLWEVVQGRCTK